MGKQKSKERIEALRLYETMKYTRKEIAEHLKVREGTIGKWIKKNEDLKKPYNKEITLINKQLNKEIISQNPCPKNIYCLVTSIKILNSIQNNK